MYENDNLAVGYALGRDSNSNNNGWGCGGEFIWIILLFAMYSMFGWGGFGGFGGGFGGGGAVGTFATQADIQRGFDNQSVMNKLNGLENGLCDGFYALNTSLLTGLNGVNTAIMQNGYDTRSGITDLGYRMQDCCCQTQRAIEGVNYNIAKSTCDITNTINSATSNILGYLTQEKISSLQAENQTLKFAASQSAQNAFITANQEAQTAELIRRLGRDCPVPAFIVPNPACCYDNRGYYGGNSCSGCNC